MAQPQECVMEFYFRSDQLLEMLKMHPGAKGVIFSQTIVPTKIGGKMYNISTLKARVDILKKKPKTKVTKAGKPSPVSDPGEGFVDGCPYPPGCTE